MTTLICPRSKRSAIWTHFEPLDMSYAICNLCEAKLSYRTSVSNLKIHLNKKHPGVQYGSSEDGVNEDGTPVAKPNHEQIKIKYYGFQDLDEDDDDYFLPFNHAKEKGKLSHTLRSSSNSNKVKPPAPVKKSTVPTQASINAQIDVENEFELFGKSIAVQLKKMSLDRALICQEKLQQVMTQERLTQMQKKGDSSDDTDSDPFIQLQHTPV